MPAVNETVNKQINFATILYLIIYLFNLPALSAYHIIFLMW